MPTAVGQDMLTSLSRRWLFPDITDIVYGSNPVFFRLNQGRKMAVPGGYQLEAPVVHKDFTTGGPVSGWDVVAVAPQDTVINAAWSWKGHQKSVVIDEQTLIEANAPEARYNLLRTQFDQAAQSMADDIGTGLMSNGVTNTKEIDGLEGAVDDGGVLTIYGGISRSLYLNWKAQDDSSTGTLSVAALRSSFLTGKSGGRTATVIISRIGQYGRALALGDTYIRYPAGAGGMDEQMYQAGFTNAIVMGCPWVEDSHTFDGPNTSNSAILLLNEDYLTLGVNPSGDFAMSPFYSSIPNGQLGWVSMLQWWGNLLCTNPARQAKLSNVSA